MLFFTPIFLFLANLATRKHTEMRISTRHKRGTAGEPQAQERERRSAAEGVALDLLPFVQDRPELHPADDDLVQEYAVAGQKRPGGETAPARDDEDDGGPSASRRP